jgi:hypothetical protein
VSGPVIGALLAETGVPVLVLNACRSAHAEPSAAPDAVDGAALVGDPHELARAYGSLAQEVMDAGVAGVVAMRYNVYVVTAAEFVANLYAQLSQGLTLGEAVSVGRKQLVAVPEREILGERVELQDWPVPIVYEAAPLRVFPAGGAAALPKITLRTSHDLPGRGALDPRLPAPPDAGFFGRDETILAIDRRFDTERIVLLHAYAGSGKTATAAEFARWYAVTGGVEGPVIFTSFERPRPLARVLDDLEPVFRGALEQQGVQWLALTDAERRDVALQMLRQVPVLWIWDNVEEVAGFPRPDDAALSADEQRELADFLRSVRTTKAKVLLTSRRDERDWLGELPGRVRMPPMALTEAVQLARALAGKRGQRIADVGAWIPLLHYAQGNPLTITVVVGQALRDGRSTAAELGDLLRQLQAGEDVFDDDEVQGRTRSLGASLSYGFAHAFSDDERKLLALLRLFRSFVAADTLYLMADPGKDWSSPEFHGTTRGTVVAILDKAAGIGLLEKVGDGYYVIHPVLPWYFARLFDQTYPPVAADGEDEPSMRAERAFANAMGDRGTGYHRLAEEGNIGVLPMLVADEANLLRAWDLALADEAWELAMDILQGLGALYGHTGRHLDKAKLISRAVPLLADPFTDDPMPGRERAWAVLMDHRVEAAMQGHDLATAERLARPWVEWHRKQAARAMAKLPSDLDLEERNLVRSLAVALHRLGGILRDNHDPEGLAQLLEAFELARTINDRSLMGGIAFNVGRAYEADGDA